MYFYTVKAENMAKKKIDKNNKNASVNSEEPVLLDLETIDLGELDLTKKDEDKKKKEAGFGSAFAESFKKIGSWFKDHKQISIIALAGAVLIAVASFVAVYVTKKNATPVENSISENEVQDPDVMVALEVPIDPLQENAYPEVNELISTYFKAMQEDDTATIVSLRKYLDTVEAVKFDVKSHYVESYQNISCFTKKGPFENSYIVYATADVKMIDWDTPAPSLQTILVCTDESGNLYIYSGAFDDNIATYIRDISSQQDVVELINRIDTTYREVMDADPAFASFMETLNQTIKDEVTEVLATQSTVISEKDTGEVLLVLDNSVSENEAVEDEAEEPSEYPVIAVSQVNVRASDSPEADAIGALKGGEETTCYENLPNGWSKIAFKDGIGYVKTEFLAKAGYTEEDAVEIRQAQDMINVRGTASADGNLMGTMQKNESVYVLEDLDSGWTKIIYKGAEAYVKTEFIK